MNQTRLFVYPMMYESSVYRLASFKHARTEVTANEVYFTQLSDAGFYYNPISSLVTCQGCQNVLQLSEFRSDPKDGRYHNTCCVYSHSNDAVSNRDATDVVGPVHQPSTNQRNSNETSVSNLEKTQKSLPVSRHETAILNSGRAK